MKFIWLTFQVLPPSAVPYELSFILASYEDTDIETLQRQGKELFATVFIGQYT